MIWGGVAGLTASPLIHVLAGRFRRSNTRCRLVGWRALAAGPISTVLITTGAITSGVVAATIRPTAAAVAFAVSFAAMLIASAVDVTEQRLPNVLTIGTGLFALAALAIVSVTTGVGDPWRAVAGGAIFGGWILLGAMIVRDGYGLGDVKLATTCGILLGWMSWPALAAGILAAQIAIALVLGFGYLRGRRRSALGPAFLVGVLVGALLA